MRDVLDTYKIHEKWATTISDDTTVVLNGGEIPMIVSDLLF